MSISSTLIEQLPIPSSNAYTQNSLTNTNMNANNMNANNMNANNMNASNMNVNNMNASNMNASTTNDQIKNYGEQLNAERTANNSHINPIDYTSQLTSVLKEANAVGATLLPSRDIPQNTISIQNDQQIKPDYIPEKENDYIGDILNKEKIISDQQKKQNTSDNVEYIFQSIQMPLLIGLLYFVFQLPYVRQSIFSMFPNLYYKDGSQKLSGYIFNSILFSSFYGLILLAINHLNKE